MELIKLKIICPICGKNVEITRSKVFGEFGGHTYLKCHGVQNITKENVIDNYSSRIIGLNT